MKIGVTYLYAIQQFGYPPSLENDFTALDDIAALGFHFLEMESLGVEHGERVWQHRRDFKSRLDDLGIHVHNFCGVDPDLVHMDAGIRNTALDRFKRTAELGAFLGAETLHLASYAPPVTYTGKRPYALDETYAFGDAFHLQIPEHFSWRAVWDALVDSCQQTADIAAQHGKTILMEPRVGEIICSPDSLLRLISDAGRPNLKANFDTAHFSAQRENIPLALMKLDGHYANLHVADNNPANTDHLPIGEGIIDWRETLRILQQQNYDGYLGLDLGGKETLANDLVRSRDRLCVLAEELGIAMEI